MAATWLACITTAIKVRTIADPDIWWHLATGEWILRNGQLPRSEPFSWTAAGQGYVAYTWAFDIVSIWIFNHMGLFGILLAIMVSCIIILFLPSLPAQVPMWAVITGFTVSLLVGVIFGVWPAVKASRLNAIECLHYE